MGGYRICENDLNPYLQSDSRSTLTALAQGKSKVLYGRVEMKYDYKDLWNLHLNGTYYNWKWEDLYNPMEPQDASYPYEDCGLKPELEINGGVGVKVMEGLNVNLGYEYAKHCNKNYEPRIYRL